MNNTPAVGAQGGGDERFRSGMRTGMFGGCFPGAGDRMRSEAWARVRHGRWKEELKANSHHVPAIALVRLEDHT